MPNVITNIYKNVSTTGSISTSADTFYIALLNDTVDAWDTSAIQRFESYADITSAEVSGTGYTAGGKQATGLALSADDVGNKTVWIGDNLSWTNSTFDAKGYGIYKVGGPLVGVITKEVGEDPISVLNSTFNLNFTLGIMNIN